jgi:hypothetical protein
VDKSLVSAESLVNKTKYLPKTKKPPAAIEIATGGLRKRLKIKRFRRRQKQ